MAEREITIDMLLSDVGENFTFTIPLTDLDLEPDNAEELSDEEHVHAAIYQWFRQTALDVENYEIEEADDE